LLPLLLLALLLLLLLLRKEALPALWLWKLANPGLPPAAAAHAT
jgi:hypothetical protein